jgi:hypothetical protein
LSSLVEKIKIEYLKIEHSLIRILYCEDKCIIKGAYRPWPIFRIKWSNSGPTLLGFKRANSGSLLPN